jgi:hypothetical protein
VNKYITVQGPLDTTGFAAIKDMPVQKHRDDWAFEQVGLMNEDELAEYFIWCDLAVRFGNAIKKTATIKAAQGTELSGLKLVAGRASYEWSNTERAIELLKEHGLTDDEIQPRSLISVAKAEQLTGERLKDLPIVDKSDGKPALVTENDKRKGIDPQDDINEAIRGF